ncbi:MAG: hypothetical protein ABEJ40_08030 [Haloarculaceae archaeon]
MDIDRVYWAAFALFGASALVQGAVRLSDGGGLQAGGTVLAAGLVLAAAAVALVRGEGVGADATGPLVRAAVVAGALVYAAVTVVELL